VSEDAREVKIVSYSEIAAARQCPLKHQLAYIERWRQPEPAGGARWLGVRWHRVMQVHYGKIAEIQTRWDGAAPWLLGERGKVRQFDVDERAEINKAVIDELTTQPDDDTLNTILWMYRNHLIVRGLQERWRVHHVEWDPTFALPDLGGKYRYQLKTRIDLVVTDIITGGVWLIDHKTGAPQGAPRNRLLELDDQFGLYTWVLAKNLIPVLGSRYQWTSTYQHKTGKHDPAEYIEDAPIDRTPGELHAIAVDAVKTAMTAYEWHADWRDAPSAPDPMQCKRMCDYANAHIAARRGTVPLRAYLTDTGYQQDPTRH
jgi:hypothetical protein